jgi:hypothetical protein
VALLAMVIVGFGVVTEVRSAGMLERRMGDLGCYLRAAWAVRTGGDLYDIHDDNGWHYNYPPLLAILAVPLADAPEGVDRAGLVPYPVSVALWYAGSLLCLFLAVHVLASALEKIAPDPSVRFQPVGCRRWWALRLLPMLACVPPIGSDLVRGQVNLLLLALICGMMAGLLRGRPWRAGLCLAGAICLKVFPAFLLIYPLWRRDLRCLGGCAIGLVLGLVLIPAAVFGPARAWTHYRTFISVTLAPGMGDHTDDSRDRELTGATSTDTQAFLAVIHNTMHPDPSTRPMWVAPGVRAAHWLLGALLTGITLMVAGRRRPDATPDTVLVLGALVLLMLLLSPVCHLHYFHLSLPLIMVLLALRPDWIGFPKPSVSLALLLGINLIANIVPRLPGMQAPRDLGMVAYATLLLWLAAVVVLRRRGRLSVAQASLNPRPAPQWAA